MTDIEQLARESGIDDSARLSPYMLQRLGVFAAAVRREALEEAAQACANLAEHEWEDPNGRRKRGDPTAEDAVAAIRALKDKPQKASET